MEQDFFWKDSGDSFWFLCRILRAIGENKKYVYLSFFEALNVKESMLVFTTSKQISFANK